MSSNDTHDSNLGPLMFERTAVSKGISLAVIMVMMIFFMAVPALGAVVGQQRFNPLTLLIPLAVIGFIFWLWRTLKRRRTQTLGCFQQGLVLSQNRTNTTLRFDELESFTASGMTITASGLTAGVETTIKCRWVRTPLDTQLAVLLELVGQSISEKMGAQLVEQGVVDWTPRTKLYTDKIVHRGLFGGEEEVSIEAITYTSMVTGDQKQEELWIYSDLPDKPTLKIPARLENFYPGYHLLGVFLAQRSEMTGEPIHVVSAAESTLAQSTGTEESSKTNWSSFAGIVWIVATVVTGLARCDRDKKRQKVRQAPPPVHQPFNQQQIDELRKNNRVVPERRPLFPLLPVDPAPDLKKVPELSPDELLPPPKL